MNVHAVYYVNQHLETLREDAAQRRFNRVAGGPSLRDRIASAFAKVTGAIETAADPDWSLLPKIHDYPYGG